MGFRNGSYCTIWSVEPGTGNFTKVRLSVSKKNKEGVYEQDFSGFCMFIGHAHAKATKLREKDRIKLGEVDVSSTYDKDKKKEYINFKVFDFEPANAPGTGSMSAGSVTGSQVDSNPTEGDVGDEEAPF